MSGRYCVLIPAFNATKTIGALVRNVKQQGYMVVVIDDGSTDQTAGVASAQGALVISHLRNCGKGRALRTGFEYALREGYDGVVTMDSDGQHDPAEIAHLIHEGELQHAGLVVGNRMTNGALMPRQRHLTNTFMSHLVSALTRQQIPDSQCGFRVIRKEVLHDVQLRTERFEIESELLLGAAARRWKIISIPVRTIYQPHYQSYIQPVPDALRFFGLILRYLVRRG